MHRITKTIQVEPGSELDRLLDDADETNLELVRGGIHYRIDRVTPHPVANLWAGYDPDAAIKGMRRAAGSWSDVDAEALKDELRRAREEGSRPLHRP